MKTQSSPEENEGHAAPVRMTLPADPPGDPALAEWIGAEASVYWQRLRQQIEEIYPDTFRPEWLYGGKRHGWSLRYKKNKSFCTLIPERNRCALLMVFGAGERAKVESLKGSLSAATRRHYDEATTYHDGKWLLLTVDSDAVMADIRVLLAVKRRPKARK